ncbi:MAG: GSU2403 family nucleotidyltransferase fold protein [Holophaga sp.]|nr:GSU2403 family nucleotidyltransferase fold protein [Holophaga sp.]
MWQWIKIRIATKKLKNLWQMPRGGVVVPDNGSKRHGGGGTPAGEGPPAAGTREHAPINLRVTRLSIETQTLLAELLEHMRSTEFAKSFSDLKGTFTARERGDGVYWYFRTTGGLGSNVKDFYIGPDDDKTRAIMKSYQAGRPDAEARADRIRRLSAMLRGGDLIITDTDSTRIIRGFAEAGVFRLGGILVGTHAFAAIGTSLGVRWPSALKTTDIDFSAYAKRIDLGIPQTPQTMASIPRVIEALEMGFVPSLHLSLKHRECQATSYNIPGADWRIDLVTATMGANLDNPIEIPRLGAYAQPLPFMDYLLERTMDAVIVGNTAVLVRVPEPARFAVHKLLVASNRGPQSALKADKDRLQSALLMSHLEREWPGNLTLAAEDAISRGSSWAKRIRQEAERLPLSCTELKATIASLRPKGKTV